MRNRLLYSIPILPYVLPTLFCFLAISEALASVTDRTIIVHHTETMSHDTGKSKLSIEKQITGQVSDGETRESIVGVSIRVKGTNIGTITDASGNYSISVPDEGVVLVFSYVGYLSMEVPVSSESVINISLDVDSKELSEVVITALGIEKDKRSVGSAVQEISGSELSEARETNMVSNLSGKIAGLNVQQTSSGVAGSVRVILRGESSLNINKNQPLFVVNGVPINNQVTSSVAGPTIDYGNGAGEINPDDIESISVLKGPSAAALYGSRAANGVIMITTKSGKGSKGLGVSVNSNITFESVLKLPDYQNEYGAGGVAQNDYYAYVASDDGPSTANTGHNWGPSFMGQQFVQYGSPLDENGKRIPIDWKAYPDNVRDFFETGRTLNNNIAIQGSNQNGNFRVSYSNMDKTGTFPNTELKRNSFALTAGYNVTEKVNISANINYVKSASDNLPTSGYAANTPMYAFIWFERNADINWLKNYWTKGKEGIQQSYFHTWADNPYFVAYEHINTLNKNRIYGNVAIDYQLSENLKLMLRSGTDFSNELRTFKRPYSSVTSPRGRYKTQEVYFNEMNTDFLLTYNKQFGDWDLTASAGGNSMKQDFRNNENDAVELTIPGVYNMGNASGLPVITEFNSSKVINSLYGSGELAYKQMVFLNVTGRNDWSSTLPLNNNSYFYPSVSLSTVFTELLNLPVGKGLSYGKLRASWAQVGNDTDPFRLKTAFNYGPLTRSVATRGDISNADLKPEIATAYEIGTDLRFFDERLGIDFTYYKMVSRNQIINVQLPITSGYTSQVLNAGEIQNEGLELVLNANPVRAGKFSWDFIVNFARNRSKVVELYEGVTNYIIASPGLGTVEARVGERMGDIYGQKLLRSPDGQIVHKDGIPQISPTIQKLGNYNPDWMGGIYNNIRYGGLYMGFMFDTKQGGEIVSYTYAAGSEAGILPHTLPGRETGIVGEGVVANGDGTFSPNTINIPAPNYYRSRYHRNVTESHTFDASFVKLREVKLGYAFSSATLASTPLRSASISLVARNLALWAEAPHIDPETTTINGATIVPGFETVELPTSRSIGFNINLAF